MKIKTRQRFFRMTMLVVNVLLFTLLIKAQPTFTKEFMPDVIGPGGTSMLVFTIDNPSASPVTSMDFTDNLPAGVIIASPGNAQNGCGGTLTAMNGGSTISLASGELIGNGSCQISVNVTANNPGVYTNTTGDLTSSAGNSGTASDDLTISTDRPGFSKSFTPSTVDLGEQSTLVFTLDNSQNPNQVTTFQFTDNLPVGMIIANPSNTTTTCVTDPVVPTFLADPGASTINYSYFGAAGVPAVAANSTCTISLDVITTGIGDLDNETTDAEVTINNVATNIGKAVASLSVDREDLHIQKTFLDDPTPPGGTATLQFTITNFDRDFAASSIIFSDDLDAGLTGLAAVGLPLNDVCGTGSTLSGTTVLSLSGGNLEAGQSCTFSTTVQIPGGASAGTYTNTTSNVSGEVNGSGRTGNSASAPLFVAPVPIFTKEFTNDPVVPGTSVDLEFSITNSSSAAQLTDIAFTDELTSFLGFPISATLPAAGTACNSGTLEIVSCGIDCQTLSFSGGTLAANESCSFTTTIDIPIDQPGGTFENTTSTITGQISGEEIVGSPAQDDLVVASAPQLNKAFLNDPILPGDPVQLQFTINLSGNASTNATNIAFTDNIDATLSGMTLTSIDANDCGGSVTGIGTGNISFSGGSLVPGGNCTILTTLATLPGSPTGTFPNITSDITATESGLGVTGSPATDDLSVLPVTFTKEFIDDPVIAGGTATLRFTIESSSPDIVYDMSFTDNLESEIAGLSAIGLPNNDVCGSGSEVSGTNVISFTQGSLLPNSSCTFDVDIMIPGNIPDGNYNNTTSPLNINIGPDNFNVPPATDILDVNSTRLLIEKDYTADPVDPDQSTTLEFTITNLDAVNAITDITFTDDLNASLTGLVATGLPLNNVCGAGSQISGAGTVTLTNGTLNPSASCTFVINVQVPDNATRGSSNTNTTSAVTGEIGGLMVSGLPATDDLIITSILPECTENTLNINQQVLNTTSQTATFHAIQELIASGSVSSNRNLTFKAGMDLEFLEDFTVNAGGILTGLIEDCPN